MEIEKRNKEWVEKVLSALEFVNWDRFFEISFASHRIINVFGWIDREDDYKDFVDIEFNIMRQEVTFLSTSSEEHSKKIADILGSMHIPCQRVEDNFDVKNVTKL